MMEIQFFGKGAFFLIVGILIFVGSIRTIKDKRYLGRTKDYSNPGSVLLDQVSGDFKYSQIDGIPAILIGIFGIVMGCIASGIGLLFIAGSFQ